MLTFDDYLKTLPEDEQRYIARGVRYLNYLYAKQQTAQQATPCGDGDAAQPATAPNPSAKRVRGTQSAELAANPIAK